jgi:hypothetical protein
MITVIATTALNRDTYPYSVSMTYGLSPCKSIQADAAERYYPTVTEMLYAQIPDIRRRHRTLEDFQRATTVNVQCSSNPQLVVKEEGHHYLVCYSDASIVAARLHNANWSWEK